MVEFGTILFTAGVNLVGKLLFRWISEGRSSVKIATVDREIAAAAASEAERRRLRADDLERASKEALRQVVERTPQLSFAKSGLSAGLRLDFNPKDPVSSKDMMISLRQRVDQLEREAARQQYIELPPGASLVPPPRAAGTSEGLSPDHKSTEAAGDKGRNMLNDLKARVDRKEAERE